MRRVGAAARAPRRDEQPPEVVAQRARTGKRGEIGRALAAALAAERSAEGGEGDRAGDEREAEAEDERRRLTRVAVSRAPDARGGEKPAREAPGTPRALAPGVDARDRPPRCHPARRPAGDSDAEAGAAELADSERGERPLARKVGAQEGAARRRRGADELAPRLDRGEDERRPFVPREGDRLGHALGPRPLAVDPQPEPGEPAAGGGLEAAIAEPPLDRSRRLRRKHRRPPPRPRADLGQQDRSIAARRRGPVALGRDRNRDGRSQREAAARARKLAGDDHRRHAHRGPLTQAEELTSSPFEIASNGDGGSRVTVTRPSRALTSTESSAHPGSAAWTASPAGAPLASASAPASTAPSASDDAVADGEELQTRRARRGSGPEPRRAARPTPDRARSPAHDPGSPGSSPRRVRATTGIGGTPGSSAGTSTRTLRRRPAADLGAASRASPGARSAPRPRRRRRRAPRERRRARPRRRSRGRSRRARAARPQAPRSARAGRSRRARPTPGRRLDGARRACRRR